jgi:hypothetical protein
MFIGELLLTFLTDDGKEITQRLRQVEFVGTFSIYDMVPYLMIPTTKFEAIMKEYELTGDHPLSKAIRDLRMRWDHEAHKSFDCRVRIDQKEKRVR